MIQIRRVLMLLCALALSGCAAISSFSEATTPLDAYTLRAPVEPPATRGSLGQDLVIETPTSDGALDTDRILIRPDPFEVAYLPRARWTDSAPVMLQTLMIRSFADTNALRYVGRRPLGGTSDFTLVSDLTDFQAELAPDGTSVTTRVRLTVRLLRESDGALLGSRTVETTAPAASTESGDVVAALDQATMAALREVTRWTLRRLGIGVSG